MTCGAMVKMCYVEVELPKGEVVGGLGCGGAGLGYAGAAAGALKLGRAAAALGCSCCCCFLFLRNRKTKEQMHRGIGEGCMRDIRISPRRWNYALIEIIGLGIFRERKLSQV